MGRINAELQQLPDSERFGNKPICDGSTVNNAGEVYISDIGNNAIGKTNPNGEWQVKR